jgi:aminopeptidase
MPLDPIDPRSFGSTAVDPNKLDRLAELAVRVGLKLQPGQDLVLTAPVAALPLVRRIAEHAYKAGAGLVTPFFSDEEMTLARYRHGQGDGFDRAAGWLYEGIGRAFDEGAARLAVVGDDPMLLSEMDADKVGRANKALAVASKPTRERITQFMTNWTIVAYPTASWARRVFPDLPRRRPWRGSRTRSLRASRIGGDDPAAEWERHNAELRRRCDWLNGTPLLRAPLHRAGDGSDHRAWPTGIAGSAARTGPSGAGTCNPNIPTEEVFHHAARGAEEGTCAAPSPCRTTAR